MIKRWFRQTPKKLDDLPNLRGENAFIIGNGPSLNAHDLNAIREIPSFASNAIYYAFERTRWRPDYYTCVDTVVLPDQSESINYWVKKLRKTRFLFPECIYPHETPFSPKPVDKIIDPRRNVYFFKTSPLDLEGTQKDIFSLAEDQSVVEPMTVTITLMQLAVKLGAKRLFLIGCDTDYVIPKEATVLDEESSREDKRIILPEDNDPNHFDPRYFGKGKLWHSPNTGLMLKHYEKVAQVCVQNGIEVFNAGIGGKLDTFPRIEFNEAISMCSTI